MLVCLAKGNTMDLKAVRTSKKRKGDNKTNDFKDYQNVVQRQHPSWFLVSLSILVHWNHKL